MNTTWLPSLSILAVCICSANTLFAKTAAGTVINNQAVLSYILTDVPNTPAEQISSNETHFVVLQVLDHTLTSLDATNVGVNSPDTHQILTFKLTNTGNGTEIYQLQRNNQLAGDTFDPLSNANPVYIENGLLAGLQTSGPYADTLFDAQAPFITLQQSASAIIYINSDIPSNLSLDSIGQVQLSALSTDAALQSSKAVGDSIPAVSAQSTERVIGPSLGKADAIGKYQVSGLVSKFSKTVIKIVDPLGGSRAITNATVTYQLMVDIHGHGTLDNIIISDPIPAHCTYVPGSLKLNNVPASDTTDADALMYANGTVTAHLGTQLPPFNAVIEFDVKLDNQ